MSDDTVHALQQETVAAGALREALAKMPGIDEETARDTIEGETNLHEAIAAAVALLNHCDAQAIGLEAILAQMQARKKRYEDRAGFVRAAIEQAMTIGNLRTLELPECTLTLAKRTGGVVITDEALIPARFWKPQDPALDRKAIGDALKGEEAIPGAELGGERVSLTVRRA